MIFKIVVQGDFGDRCLESRDRSQIIGCFTLWAVSSSCEANPVKKKREHQLLTTPAIVRSYSFLLLHLGRERHHAYSPALKCANRIQRAWRSPPSCKFIIDASKRGVCQKDPKRAGPWRQVSTDGR